MSEDTVQETGGRGQVSDSLRDEGTKRQPEVRGLNRSEAEIAEGKPETGTEEKAADGPKANGLHGNQLIKEREMSEVGGRKAEVGELKRRRDEETKRRKD